MKMKNKKLILFLILPLFALGLHFATYRINGLKSLENQALAPYFTPSIKRCDTLLVINFLKYDPFDSPQYYWPNVQKDSLVIKMEFYCKHLIFLKLETNLSDIGIQQEKYCSYQMYMKKPDTVFPDIVGELIESIKSSDGYQYNRTISCRWILFRWFKRMEVLNLNHPCD